MTTKAAPLCEGTAARKLRSASSPPAEAPMATMGKLVLVTEAGAAISRIEDFSWRCSVTFSLRLRVLLFFGAFGMNDPTKRGQYRSAVCTGQF